MEDFEICVPTVGDCAMETAVHLGTSPISVRFSLPEGFNLVCTD